MSVLLFPPISLNVFLLSSGHGGEFISPPVSVHVVSGELVHECGGPEKRVQVWIHILNLCVLKRTVCAVCV